MRNLNLKKTLFKFIACIIAVLLFASLSWILTSKSANANTNIGIPYEGHVYDKNNNPLAGVSVCALDNKAQIKYQVQTQSEGDIGHYYLEIDPSQGFPSYWLVQLPNSQYSETLKYFIPPTEINIEDFVLDDAIPGSFAGAVDDTAHNGFKALSYFDGNFVKSGEVPAELTMPTAMHNGAAVGVVTTDSMDKAIHYAYDNNNGPHVDTYIIPVAKDGFEAKQWTLNGMTLQNDLDPQIYIGDGNASEYNFVCSYKTSSPGADLVADINLEFVDGGINWANINGGASAQTGDLSFLCFIILIALIILAAFFAYQKRNNAEFCAKSFSIFNRQINISSISTKLIVAAGIIVTALLLSTLLLTVTKVVFADTSSDSNAVKAYVHDDGSIDVDTFTLDDKSGYQMDIKKISTGLKNVEPTLNNAILNVDLNGQQVYSQTVPGQNDANIKCEKSYDVKFTFDNMDRDTAITLVGKQTIGLKFNYDDVVPTYDVKVDLIKGNMDPAFVPAGWVLVDGEDNVYHRSFYEGTQVSEIISNWDLSKMGGEEYENVISWNNAEGILDADREISANWGEAKVVVTSTGQDTENPVYTYTFYCDNQDHSMDANYLTQYYVNNSKFDIYGPSYCIAPNWIDIDKEAPCEFNPDKVIIDSSFILDSKLNSISMWFFGMKTSEFSGFENINMNNVKEAVNTFSGLSNISDLDVSMLDTSHVVDMRKMFDGKIGVSKLSSINLVGGKFSTSSVKCMINMFSNNPLSTIDISNFSFDNVESVDNMFYDCYELTSIDFPNEIHTDNLNSMQNLFYYCPKLVLDNNDLNKFDISKVTNLNGVFSNCLELTNLSLNWDTENVTSMSSMFLMGESSASKLKTVVLGENFCSKNLSSVNNMFRYCNNLVSIEAKSMDLTNVSDMSYMFCGCESLTSINFASLSSKNATNISYMFQNCSKLKNLSLEGWDTSKVILSSYMLAGCGSLCEFTIDSGWTLKMDACWLDDKTKWYKDGDTTKTYSPSEIDGSNPGKYTKAS